MPIETVAAKPQAHKVPRGAGTPFRMQRMLIAERWVPRYQRELKKVLDKYVRLAARQALSGQVDPARLNPQMEQDLKRVKERWIYAIAEEGYDLTKLELPELGKAMRKRPVDIGGEEGAEFLLRGSFENIDDWIETTSASESRTQARKMERVWKDATRSRDPETGQAWTAREISAAMERRGLADTTARADMLARTGAIWSANEGAVQRYRDAGVTVIQWDATADAATCPFCQAMDGQAVKIEDSFWSAGSEMGVRLPEGGVKSLKLPNSITHPPLHPNCRCTLVPVVQTIQVPVSAPRAITARKRRPKRVSSMRDRPAVPKRKRKAAADFSDQSRKKGYTPKYKEWKEKAMEDPDKDHIYGWQGNSSYMTGIRNAEANRNVGFETGRNVIEEATFKGMKRIAREFNRMLDRAPIRGGTVYRGIRASDATLAQLVAQKTMKFKSSASTSRNERIARMFARRSQDAEGRNRILLRMKTKTSVDVTGWTGKTYVKEREQIVRKGTNFRVTGVRKIKDFTYINLEEI